MDSRVVLGISRLGPLPLLLSLRLLPLPVDLLRHGRPAPSPTLSYECARTQTIMSACDQDQAVTSYSTSPGQAAYCPSTPPIPRLSLCTAILGHALMELLKQFATRNGAS
ncbi:hypothetical protein HD554DRAFT_2071781 [Boletus coccyginus]|nr:hypothetical protein HD554DRAFT_2071781 [Boletus coccyginus]